MATVLKIPSPCFSNNAISSSTLLKNGEIRGFGASISNMKPSYRRLRIRAMKEKTEEIKNPSSPEEITEKYGLEAGLWEILSSKKEGKEGKEDQAKELLTKYGLAYFLTSISLSVISFGLCYALISVGVDVPALLLTVGIPTNETGEKVGTLALAYAAHKAASPIRFPPTVALTPVVASWFRFGKKVDEEK